MTAGSPPRSPHTAWTATRVAAAALGAITAAVIPALAGLVLLGSAAVRRPMLGRQNLTPADGAPGPAATRQPGRAASRLTLLWGTGLILTGLVQGLMALTAGTSVTNPHGMLTRTLAGLAGEALLALATVAWLRPRTSARARHSDTAPPVPAGLPAHTPVPPQDPPAPVGTPTRPPTGAGRRA